MIRIITWDVQQNAIEIRWNNSAKLIMIYVVWSKEYQDYYLYLCCFCCNILFEQAMNWFISEYHKMVKINSMKIEELVKRIL